MSLTGSEGHSTFRLTAYENEWNVVAATLIPPSPLGRTGNMRSAFRALDGLKSSDRTRLLIVFCPAWAVSKLMHVAVTKKDMGNWTWIFSDLGNKKVKHGYCRVQ